jgi:hypothetical protein
LTPEEGAAVTADGPRGFSFLPLLFLVGALFELANAAYEDLFDRFVYLPSTSSASPALSSEELQFISSFVSFVITPILLFAVFYLLGRRSKGLDRWRALVTVLFLGGVVGASFGTLIGYITYPPSYAPSFLSFLKLEFGDLWFVLSLAVFAAEEGLYTAFIGVAAFFIAGARKREGEAAEVTEPLQPVTGPS